MRFRFLLLFFFCFLKGKTQTLAQWAQTVNWDGVSYFAKYINFNSAHMGPNALTVPFISNGSIDSITTAGFAGQIHLSKGDKTQNINVYGNYCLVKNAVSLDLAWIPVEFFSMSDTIKRERHVYYKNYYDKKAKGDIVLNTTINLLNKWRDKIQLALRIGVRLPSSSYKGVAAARFVDAPGYYVDVSCGKQISPSVKWISMLGLFVWQIDEDDLRQNDAFLFGTGLEWNKNNWRIQTDLSGYLGYIYKSGDKPIVYRFNLEKKSKRTSLLFRFQQGLQDFKYSSVEMGMKYLFRGK